MNTQNRKLHKTLVHGLLLGVLALAISGCYYAPAAYPDYSYYPSYGYYPAYGYYPGPAVSFTYVNRPYRHW